MPAMQEPIVLENRSAESTRRNASRAASRFALPLRALRHAFYGREDEIRSNSGKGDGLVGLRTIGGVTNIRGVAPVTP
jgi:hypothetical protein